PGIRTLRCLIVGINQNAIADGDLLQLILSVRPDSPPGPLGLRVSNVAAVDADGAIVPLDPTTASIRVQGGPVGLSLQTDNVRNAASLLTGPVSPGEIVTLLGSFGSGFLDPAAGLRFNGIAAPILYAADTQLNAMVPFGLDTARPAKLELRSPASTATSSIQVQPAAPAIFTQNANGTGPG